MQVRLGDGTTAWVVVDAGTVHGRGRVAPRLAFTMNARTVRQNMVVQIHLLRAELLVAGERLGQDMLTGEYLSPGDSQLTVEIPVDRPTLDFFDRVATDREVNASLRLSGWLRGRDDNTDLPQYASRPQPGEWVFERFGVAAQTELSFRIARSDWFSQVLEPLGTVDYLFTEIAIPRGDSPLRKSADHLRAAERAYREGGDPQVFSSCRAAIDALPGAKTDIFANLEFERERSALDGLLRSAGVYFHLGRHAADEGPLRGEFPVDHADAAFALNLAKLIVAQTARVLERPPRR